MTITQCQKNNSKLFGKQSLILLQADTSLQEKLRAATDADSIASIAKEAGFEITAEDVKEAQAQLSDEQLEGVDGGVGCGSRACERFFKDVFGCW